MRHPTSGRLGIPGLRRRLFGGGGHPASTTAERAQGRSEGAEYRPARLVEPPLRHHPVGPPEAWTEDIAFLDGTQHVELVGYVGAAPILAAAVRAAVRLRSARRSRLVSLVERQIVLARAAALAMLGADLAEFDPIILDDEEPTHPVRDLDRAHAEVDRARTGVEIAAAAAFRTERAGDRPWLVADGSLAISPDWARDDRMIGVVKSHGVLPFTGPDLETYLTLPAGQRTSVFAPESRQRAPVHSWALRLHDFTGRDLFHGLVRIEVPVSDDPVGRAEVLSRRLLAERAPLATDRRADRLLYGIHDVERFLHAREA